MILLKSINVRLKFLNKFYLAKLEKTFNVIKRANVIRRHLQTYSLDLKRKHTYIHSEIST